jgi:glucose uptake protein
MYQPEAYLVVLSFMIVSMICWGSWANTMKLTPRWPFPLFYWDYVLGLLLTSLVLALTLGNFRGGPSAFLANILQVDKSHIGYGLLAGALFNISNLLLVAATAIAGLAVAFPIGVGLALVIGAVMNYVLAPRGNPILLSGGVALVTLAIVCDALAYRKREAGPQKVGSKGILLSLACGVFMGLSYPVTIRATLGEHALGPYSVVVVFAIGALLCAIPVNYLFMRKPVTGNAPLSMGDYAAGRGWFHWIGVLGGGIWCFGTVLNLVASHVQVVGPAVSYTIGQGATMVSAAWGVFVWREFANAPRTSKRWLVAMFVCFLAGLGSVALAPLFTV